MSLAWIVNPPAAPEPRGRIVAPLGAWGKLYERLATVDYPARRRKWRLKLRNGPVRYAEYLRKKRDAGRKRRAAMSQEAKETRREYDRARRNRGNIPKEAKVVDKA